MRFKLAAILALAFLASCGDDGGTGGSGGSGGNGLSSDDEQLSSSGGEEPDSMQKLAGTMTYGGRTYKTIQIGSQTWMAENLNYEYKIDGSTYGNFCYKLSADSCGKYGRLYTWAAAMDTATTGCGRGAACSASSGRVQGVCPNGWHLPDSAEWEALFAVVGGANRAGETLRAFTGWESGPVSGTDLYGFSALPSGFGCTPQPDPDGGDYVGLFYGAGSSANIWSSSVDERDNPYYMYIHYTSVDVYLYGDNEYNSYAVRCVKDSD